MEPVTDHGLTEAEVRLLEETLRKLPDDGTRVTVTRTATIRRPSL